MKNIFAIVCATTALSACATAPLVVPVERTVTTTKTKDEVWANLIEFFAAQNIAIKTIEKDSGIVYAERSFSGVGGMRGWADCGAAMMAPPISQSVDLNVFVRDLGTTSGDRTTLTVNARFSETRRSALDNTLATVDCSSLGALEGLIQREATK